jgi:monovalent cation:H+ antiporter-2, CPA2 family
MVGLEFSFPAMMKARADILGAGSLQIGITTLIVTGCAALLGVTLPAAVLLGGAVAMSSTAITLKQLAEQGEITTDHGRRALAISLFQDFAALPFLVAIGAWGQSGVADAWLVFARLMIAAVAVVGAALICRPVFRFVLARVALAKSTDLFLLTVLLLALGTALTVHLAGLAAPIGAFLAGMVVGESDFRHQVEDDVRPFRDVLVGLFFVTVGMEVNPSVIAIAPLATFGGIIAFLPGKALLTLAIGTIMRWPPHVGIRVAVILAHGGEFGLLLLTQAIRVRVVEADVGQPALLGLVVSMALGPILIQRNAWIAEHLGRASHRLRAAAEEGAIREESSHLNDHVLLCGCGRVGRLVALVLEAAHVQYIAVEADLARFRSAKQQGLNVVFGDASRKRILEAAGLTRARVIVVTFDHRHAVERLLHHVRQDGPIIPSIVSTKDDRDLLTMVAAGAAIVFPENFAAGLALADQVLLLSGFTQEDAAKVVTTVRAELSPELTGRIGL